jgi:hypothetical protein
MAATDQLFFFSVRHIIKPFATKLIYGIRYNGLDYFLIKTLGINDCEHLDSHPMIDQPAYDKICDVITAIEKEYKKTPPIEFINLELHNILVKMANPRYKAD